MLLEPRVELAVDRQLARGGHRRDQRRRQRQVARGAEPGRRFEPDLVALARHLDLELDPVRAGGARRCRPARARGLSRQGHACAIR